MQRGIALVSLLLLTSLANAAGFDRSYTLHVGDVDADGLTDVYVHWKPAIVLVPLDDISIPVPLKPRGVANFVLRQTAPGSFSILANLSSAQLGAVSGWPELAAAVVRVIEDFDADGFMDLALRNLKAAIPGVPDQIIYATPAQNSPPAQARSIDAALLKFAQELYGWITDADYFRDHARRLTVPSGTYETYLGHILEPYPPWHAASCVFYDRCEYLYGNINNPSVDPHDNDAIQNVWHWWGIHVVTGGTRLDYSVFDRRALDLAGVLTPVIAGQQDIVAGGTLEQQIKNILAAVLGKPVYGGVFALQQNVYIDEEDIQTDRLRALLQLLASLAPPTASFASFTNPLPGAWINKVNRSGQYSCTADGRFGTFRRGGHGGVDLGSSATVPVQVGTNVVAAADGTAVPGTGAGHGTLVELYYPDYIFRYSHLSGANPRGRVSGGAVVGQVGKTGNASAACIKPHLHFEVGDRALGILVDPASVSPVFSWSLEP